MISETTIAAIPFWKRPIQFDTGFPMTDKELIARYNPEPPRPTYKGTVYLGGPVSGLGYDDARHGWRQQFAIHMPRGIICLSPMRQEGHLAEVGLIDDTALPEHPFSEHDFIFTKDVLDIRRSDVVVFNFLGATAVSKGSLIELGMAYAYLKTILVCMEATDIHQHVFVREAALVFPLFSDLIEATKSLLSEGV